MSSLFTYSEIRKFIAQYLSQQDLAICARVSHSWHEFFECFVWRSLKVVEDESPGVVSVPWAIIKCHLDEIEQVDYRASQRYDSIERLNCPRLKNLTLRLNSFNGLQEHIIFRHQTLVHLDFGANQYITGAHSFTSFWSTVASCSSLRSLSVSRVDVAPRSWASFWSIWSRLTILHLRELGIHTWYENVAGAVPASGPKSFFQGSVESRIQELGLFDIHGLTGIDSYLLLTSLCPNLETFLWHHTKKLRGGRGGMGALLTDRTSTCPRLVNFSLKVKSSTTNDELLPFLTARLVHASPIKELNVGGNAVGLRSGMELLERDGSSLRILELKDCPGVSSVMAHRLLCHLPNLESFSAPLLQDWDVKFDHQRSWACLGLKKLCLGLHWMGTSAAQVPSPTTDRGLFKRLDKLGSLRSLTVTKYQFHQSDSLQDAYATSNPTFGQVLQSLPGLVRLETLDMTDTNQAFTEQDVLCITENWPLLKSIVGTLHVSPEIDVRLRKMFEDRGVRKNVAQPGTVLICGMND
ncbi:hypothetical protein BGZ83_002159 [Gryganskiella cystojenkinii]|nr:hypothetical protein BGZ83_002159 [Gryganskiella cystojenkinii]